MHTVKPVDIALTVICAQETGAIVTAEEHSIIGGSGGAIAEIIVRECPVPVEMIGIADQFTETSIDFDELLDHYGMAVKDIVKAAKKAINRKKHLSD